jgi:hypothetical protein
LWFKPSSRSGRGNLRLVDNDGDKGKSNSGPPFPTESSDADKSGTAIGDSVSERSAENIGGNRELDSHPAS